MSSCTTSRAVMFSILDRQADNCMAVMLNKACHTSLRMVVMLKHIVMLPIVVMLVHDVMLSNVCYRVKHDVMLCHVRPSC
jgi:hypothetical protein